MRGYRFVTEKLESEHGGVKWKIGEWQKHDGDLELCDSGLHASKQPVDSLTYVFGCRWFQVEAKGKILRDTDKFVASEMRLVREIPVTVIKRFALECAKHVLHFFEEKHPEDKRPRLAIEAAETYLAEPTEENLKKLDAAWGAVRAAACDAAGDAVRATTWARAAACDAAGDAVRATTWAAEAAARAAGDAARAATWATARAAGDAARAATWATARDVERRWQNRKLKRLIKEAER